MELIKSEDWLTERFINVQPNPIQRNTDLRAKHAVKKHLSKVSPSQRRVSIAKFKGDMFKLDGHTRSLLWKQKELEMPKKVMVDIYKVDSLLHLKELYQHFDNSQAQETANDKIFGAMNGAGLQAVSTLLNYGGLTTALQLIDPYKKYVGGKYRKLHVLVHDWVDTLEIIEQANFKRIHFVAGLIIALLLTVKKDPEAIKFWLAYVEDKGCKDGENVCGVYKLKLFMEYMQHRRKLSGHKNAIEIANTAITCYEQWTLDQTFTKKAKIKQTDCFRYRNDVCIELMKTFDDWYADNPQPIKPVRKTGIRKNKKSSKSFFEEEQIELV